MASSTVTTTVPFVTTTKHMWINDLLKRYIDYVIQKNKKGTKDIGLMDFQNSSLGKIWSKEEDLYTLNDIKRKC